MTNIARQFDPSNQEDGDFGRLIGVVLQGVKNARKAAEKERGE